MCRYEEKKVDTIILCGLYFIPFVLHTIGFYLLLKISAKNYFKPTQCLYLFNLSVSEILISLGKIVYLVLMLLNYTTHSLRVESLQRSGMFLYYILVMLLITVDRFIEVHYNIRYHLVWSKRKTKVLLFLAKVLSICFALVMCITQKNRCQMIYNLSVYFWPTSEGVFIVVAVVTYCYIIRKMYKNYQQDHKHSIRKTRAKQNFYCPTLLIITFVIFWIIPDQIEFFYAFRGEERSMKYELTINVAYVFAMVSDALVYIFTPKAIRTLLWRYARNCWLHHC